MSIGGTINYMAEGYSYYCKECKTDHVFPYGNIVQNTPCGKRLIGLEKKCEINKIHSRFIDSGNCIHEVGEFSMFTKCGANLFLHPDIMHYLKKVPYCPYCGKKIARIGEQ